MTLNKKPPETPGRFTYVLADHLGSGSILLNSAGTKLIGESFSAYGYRRTSGTWSGQLSASSSDYSTIASTTRRGFTDGFHEMLDNLDLIHMNGRVYDPVIGRFLSTDPVVAMAGNSQSLNPYSYVQTRPLTLTDPTGMVASTVKPGMPCIDNCTGPRRDLPSTIFANMYGGMTTGAAPGFQLMAPTGWGGWGSVGAGAFALASVGDAQAAADATAAARGNGQTVTLVVGPLTPVSTSEKQPPSLDAVCTPDQAAEWLVAGIAAMGEQMDLTQSVLETLSAAGQQGVDLSAWREGFASLGNAAGRLGIAAVGVEVVVDLVQVANAASSGSWAAAAAPMADAQFHGIDYVITDALVGAAPETFGVTGAAAIGYKLIGGSKPFYNGVQGVQIPNNFFPVH